MRECLLQMKFRDVNVFIVVIIFDRVTQIGVHKGVNDGEVTFIEKGFQDFTRSVTSDLTIKVLYDHKTRI